MCSLYKLSCRRLSELFKCLTVSLASSVEMIAPTFLSGPCGDPQSTVTGRHGRNSLALWSEQVWRPCCCHAVACLTSMWETCRRVTAWWLNLAALHVQQVLSRIIFSKHRSQLDTIWRCRNSASQTILYTFQLMHCRYQTVLLDNRGAWVCIALRRLDHTSVYFTGSSCDRL